MINVDEQVMKLIQDAFDYSHEHSSKVSILLEKLARIARLRNDFENMFWIHLELIGSKFDIRLAQTVFPEMFEMYTPDEAGAKLLSILNMVEQNRAVFDKDTNGYITIALGVSVIERQVAYLIEMTKPEYIERAGQAYISSLDILNSYEIYLSSLRHRIVNFLIDTEKQIIFSQINDSIFEQNRRFVDEQIQRIAPDVLGEFNAAYRALGQGNKAAASQAVLSCRRILKVFADHVYPARPDPVTGVDGKQRNLTDDRYIARLGQYLTDSVKESRVRALMLARVDELGTRLNTLNELTHKGVHAEVSMFETNQCVIQTYLLIGDIMHFVQEAEKSS